MTGFPSALCAGFFALALSACSRATPPAATAPLQAPTPAASGSAAEPDEPITPDEETAVLDAMIPLLEKHYLDPPVARTMIAALRDPARRAAYARIPMRHAFGRAVTDDLRAISHDMHVILHYEPPKGDAGRPGAYAAHEKEIAENAGFAAVERWSGNVAYVRIESFGPYADSVNGEAMYAAKMAKVADADALVLDLRGNYGGYPEMVAVLLSYLTEGPPVHLVDFWDHDDGSTSASWTKATVAGPRFGAKKPVYVLIDRETFSGGEEAAYDLHALSRAVLIGERTAGGANFAPHHAISPHFTFAVPQGRTTSAITGKSWEGVGVEPDVAVPASAALKEARARATGAKSAKEPAGAAGD